MASSGANTSGRGTNATGTSGGLVLPDIGGAVGQQVYLSDRILWFIARTVEITILCVIIGVAFKFRHVIKAAAQPRVNKLFMGPRLRRCRRCLIYAFCCAWAPRGMSLAEHIGFEPLGPAGVLRVTLICATEITKKLSFFIKVWTEPVDGPKKISRVHREVTGPAYDLGSESLQLDWYGDEDVLVVQAVEPGPVPGEGRDTPLAEVRIPRSQVAKYAELSANTGGSADEAARSFSLRPPEGKSTSAGSNVDPLAAMVVKQVQTSVGMEPTDPDELEQLREENRRMKYILSTHQPSAVQSDQNGAADQLLAQSISIMKVALRFEWDNSKAKTIDPSIYKRSSRDLEESPRLIR